MQEYETRHSYKKLLFPVLREKRFVGGHRRIGHRVTHYAGGQAARCYWRCNCGARYRC